MDPFGASFESTKLFRSVIHYVRTFNTRRFGHEAGLAFLPAFISSPSQNFLPSTAFMRTRTPLYLWTAVEPLDELPFPIGGPGASSA
jgi:hypothetical protein